MKPLTIQKEQRGDVCILSLSGALVRGNEESPLKSTVRTTLDLGSKTILLDLRQVPYIDSGGIVDLVSAHTSATSRGARVKLAHLDPKVKNLLEMVRVLQIFETYPTLGEALHSQ
jgi:anti-sigma B factor antagonist